MANTAHKTDTEEWPREGWTELEAALFYAAKGWPVFPVRLDGADKRPLVKDWPHAATTDRGQLKKWWGKWPDAGIGMPCGKASGLGVIDIDVKNAAPGKENAKALAKEHGGFTSGLWSRTPTDGIHQYFRWEELPFKSGAGKNQGGIAEGIDIRSQDIDGNGTGFIVLPPSCPPGVTLTNGVERMKASTRCQMASHTSHASPPRCASTSTPRLASRRASCRVGAKSGSQHTKTTVYLDRVG